jgi:RimJ/RimL family protein N-acetyltransferase
MEIRTPRLTLRTARPDDLAAMHVVLSSVEATRWWSTPPHVDMDQTHDWLASMIAKGPENPDFVVEVEGRAVGKAGFFTPPEIGYILHPDVWGRGLAFEACRAALDHLFTTTGHAEATADVDPENAASIRLLEKLGFVRTGFRARTWNVGGEWKDSFFYGLSRGEWASRGEA